MDVISSLQAAIDIAGQLRSLSKKVGDAEFKMLLADLSNELADAKLEVANLKIELARAREDLDDARRRQSDRNLSPLDVYEGGYRFANRDGLFCTGCFDTKQQLVRLAQLQGHFRVFGKWACPACKSKVGPTEDSVMPDGIAP